MITIVVTTIQPPTVSMEKLIEKARAHGATLVVIGDRKTPDVQWPAPVHFMSIGAQTSLQFSLGNALPENHYSRKNIGYLLAIAQGSTCIYDTDDDNAPLVSWRPRQQQTLARRYVCDGWVNVYQWFSDTHVWPRGLPLESTRRTATVQTGDLVRIDAPVQQGLANGSPDVDAIWRLLVDQEITFKEAESISLPQGAWCPFNSQSTWWFPVAYPLMYLPSYVSFRMTDIWRSFIAQRCLWALECELVFHGAEVIQDRNPHNLLRDFEQEVPGYLGNEKFRNVLQGLSLPGGSHEVGQNLHRCYDALIRAGLVPPAEICLVEQWLADLASSGV